MQKIKIILGLAILALTFSCQTVRVSYDYDQNVDFAAFSTYNYPKDHSTGLGELDTKRLTKIMDSILSAKGFSKTDNADLLLYIHSREYETLNQNTVGVGVGGTGRNIGGGVQVGIPLSGGNLNREVVFDFVHQSGDQLLFQAVTESKLGSNQSPSTRYKILLKIASNVMEEFPPR